VESARRKTPAVEIGRVYDVRHTQVPVQRVTKYPLLLARLLKASPASAAAERRALTAAKDRVEQALERMNKVSPSLSSLAFRWDKDTERRQTLCDKLVHTHC